MPFVSIVPIVLFPPWVPSMDQFTDVFAPFVVAVNCWVALMRTVALEGDTTIPEGGALPTVMFTDAFAGTGVVVPELDDDIVRADCGVDERVYLVDVRLVL